VVICRHSWLLVDREVTPVILRLFNIPREGLAGDVARMDREQVLAGLV